MTSIHSLQDLYFHELEMITTAEKQILANMPILAMSATGDLESAARYVTQTRERVERLESILKLAKRQPTSTACRAFEGLFSDARDLIDAIKDHDTRVSALLATMKIARHDILGRYAALASWGRALGRLDEAKILLGATDDTSTSLPHTDVVQADNKPEPKTISMGDRLTALLDRKK
jgi:ferritin-like metal-binding protein YciE